MSATTTLIGNTTSDVELRYSQNGKAIGNVTIAVSDRTKDASGNWVDGKTWFARCTLWGEVAEHAAGSLHKGTRVIAFGRLEQNDWEDKEGNKRSTVQVTVDEIGPSLRYSTAQVTRTERTGSGTSAPERPGHATSAPAVSEEPWATASVPADDWTQPTSYNDETPF